MKTNTKINTKNTKCAKRWIILILFVFSFANCGQAAIASDITAQRMIELTNKSREESGFLSLKVNSKLTAAANAKADDMFKFQYFDHNSPNGVTPWYWIKSAGYDYLYAGENLAIDFVTAEGTHIALMRSITHRDNILKPDYTEIGIAVKKGIFEGNESIIIVQQFGAPLEKVVEEDKESKVVVKGDVDISSQENKEESKTESKTEETKIELVEIKSPVVYFRDEDYEKNKNEEEENKDDENNEEIKEAEEVKELIIEEMTIEEINMEFVFPIMFPVENIKPLDKNLTENIFWNNYEKDEEGIFGKIISFFDYKFLFVKMDLLAK